MTKRHLKTEIENKSTNNIQISDDLADILVFACQRNLTPSGGAMKTKNLCHACNEATYNRLRRLEKLGFLTGYQDGAETYLVHLPTGEYLDRSNFQPTLRREIAKMKQHMNSNPAVEQIVADAIDVPPAKAAQELDKGTVWDQQQMLEAAVDAIQATGSVSVGNYGKIIIRNSPKFWHATGRTVRLFNKP